MITPRQTPIYRIKKTDRFRDPLIYYCLSVPDQRYGEVIDRIGDIAVLFHGIEEGGEHIRVLEFYRGFVMEGIEIIGGVAELEAGSPQVFWAGRSTMV